MINRLIEIGRNKIIVGGRSLTFSPCISVSGFHEELNFLLRLF